MQSTVRRWPSVAEIALTADALADRVVSALELQTQPGDVPSVEDIQDVVEKVLIEAGHARTAKAYILYREERSRRRRERAARSARCCSDSIPWQKVWESLDWAVEHGVHTVEALNGRIARGEFVQIVRETDHAYNEDITCAAEMIREREDSTRVVIIAGPSSSGKDDNHHQAQPSDQQDGQDAGAAHGGPLLL